jgi:hypothetical protein
MHINSLFPSKYVAASDLPGDVAVTIAKIEIEEVGQDKEPRPVLYFYGKGKGMVLNKTNANRIKAMYGSEVNLWVGQSITLYPSETEFAGETVPCIRVRQTPPQGIVTAPTPVAPVAPPTPTPAAPVPTAPPAAGGW